MKITDHFDSNEFDCRDGTDYPIEWIALRLVPLCEALEKIRALTGQPIAIFSGYRTKSYNKKVGGEPQSQHMQGTAADFMLKGMTILQTYNAIEDLIKAKVIPQGGLGLYTTWIHYDQRGVKARWKGKGVL